MCSADRQPDYLANTIASFFVLGVVLGGGACLAQETFTGPTDARISPNARRLYDYLQVLPQRTSKRIVSGQVFDKTWESFQHNVVQLHEKTGKWLGMLHSWPDFPWTAGKRHLSFEFIYPLYYNYYHRGGVLMLLVNPYNPWTGKSIRVDPRAPERYSLAELLSPDNQAYHVYRQYLSNLADNLEYFAKEDIPLILRLYGENNGKWFWFHHGQDHVSPEEFRALWTYTVNYLRDERELHNLLFCYEVTESRGNRLQGLVADHTDILGIQCQRDPLTRTLELYNEYVPFGKPIMMPQFLPYGHGGLDFKAYIDGLRRHNPKVVAFSPWADQSKKTKAKTKARAKHKPRNQPKAKPQRKPQGNAHAIVANLNADALMSDPWIITREDTPWVRETPPPELPVPKAESDGTRLAPPGPHTWNFNRTGNEQWSGTTTILKMYASGQRLNVFYHGRSPSIASPETLGIQASKYLWMKIRARNHSTSRRMILQWIARADSQWDELKQTEFVVNNNGRSYTEYEVDLSRHAKWNGIISQVRLGLAPDSVTGSGEIDFISFTPSN